MDVVKGFKPELLLFAAFFATIPFFSPNFTVFQSVFESADAAIGPFAQTVLVFGVAGGLGAVLLATKGKGRLLLAAPTVAAAVLCYAVGYLGLVLALALGLPLPLLVLAAVLTSLGGLVLCIAWGALLARFGLRRAIFWLSLTTAGGSFIVLMLSSVAQGIALFSFAVLVAAGCAVPAWTALRGEFSAPKAQEPGKAGTGPSVFEETGGIPWRREGESVLQLLGRMGTVLFVPFAGLLMFAFITGVRKFMLFNVVYMEDLGIILGALVAVPLSLVKTRRPLLPFVYQVVLPLFALALIVLNSFPQSTPPLWLAAWVSYGFFGLIAILALASLCAMAHAGEFPVSLIYGVTVAAFCLVSLAGMGCGVLPPFQEQNGGPALLVVSTLYFAFLIAMALNAGWQLQEREAGEEGASAPSVREDFAARCQENARAHGLSPREAEIFAFLARGHTPAFIAKTLVISESTVRTHVKSIYRKLGVSSREELLAMVDE